MAVNAKYLFLTEGVYINSFSTAPDGSIKQVASINAQQFNSGGCGGPANLFLDRTGTTLYDVDFNQNCSGDDDAFQFFSIDASTGELSYFGVTAATWSYWVPVTFTGNNEYAYASECSEYSDIFGFQRNDDGTLSPLNINPSVPTAPKGYSYCPNQMVADSATIRHRPHAQAMDTNRRSTLPRHSLRPILPTVRETSRLKARASICRRPQFRLLPILRCLPLANYWRLQD